MLYSYTFYSHRSSDVSIESTTANSSLCSHKMCEVFGGTIQCVSFDVTIMIHRNSRVLGPKQRLKAFAVSELWNVAADNRHSQKHKGQTFLRTEHNLSHC